MRVLSTRLYTVGIALEGLIGGGQHTRRSLRPAAAIACLAAFLFVIGWVSTDSATAADTNCSDLGYGTFCMWSNAGYGGTFFYVTQGSVNNNYHYVGDQF